MNRSIRKISNALRQRLKGHTRQGRRETIYRMLLKKNYGRVPCFVCGHHVEKKDATLEHIQPRSKGGMDDMGNLSISHRLCNQARGNCDRPVTHEAEALGDKENGK